MMMANQRRPLARTGLVIITIAVGALVFWLMRHKSPLPVDLASVDRGSIAVTVSDDGITSVHDVYTVAAPVAGRVMRIDAEVGDKVVAGRSVVAHLAPAGAGFLDERSRAMAQASLRAAAAQHDAAIAETRRADSALQLARRDFDRIAPLAERGTVSRATLDRSRATRDEAGAALATARANASAAENAESVARAQLATPAGGDGSGTVTVRAPVSGAVLRIIQKSEAVVAAGASLIEIGDPTGDLEVVVDLLSSDAVKVRPGARVNIEDWGGPEPLVGRVRLVEPFGFLKVSALGVEEQRVNVRIDLVGDRSSHALLGHGYRVVARIVTDEAANVVRVPVNALVRTGQDWSVFISDHGKARRRKVQIGLMNDEFAEVRGGLVPGEQVVLFPGESIVDGSALTERGNAAPD
jgi:HlyD family secretion protein